MKKTMAWTILSPGDDEPGTFISGTRDEAIRHECWNHHEVGYLSGVAQPWHFVDAKEVSRAWRRMKRKYGCRAARVLIEVHPKYLEDDR